MMMTRRVRRARRSSASIAGATDESYRHGCRVNLTVRAALSGAKPAACGAEPGGAPPPQTTEHGRSALRRRRVDQGARVERPCASPRACSPDKRRTAGSAPVPTDRGHPATDQIIEPENTPDLFRCDRIDP